MTVSVSLVSSALAQSWADRLHAQLVTEGVPLSLTAVREHLAQIWGAPDWQTLAKRKQEPVENHEDLSLVCIKAWVKQLHRRLKVAGQPLPLTRVQTLCAKALGGSGWPGLKGWLATINAQRAQRARYTPKWPHPEGMCYIELFDLTVWPQDVVDRVWELGQHWVDARGSQTRWRRFWPAINQVERDILCALGPSGHFQGLEPLAKRKRQAPLAALPRALENPFQQLEIALHQHLVPHDDLWRALLTVQEQAPLALRVPESALSELVDLLTGQGRLMWAPFGRDKRREACRDIVARHAPEVAAHPSFHLVDAWAAAVADQMFEQRQSFLYHDDVMSWPLTLKLYPVGKETTPEGLALNWDMRIEQH
jgi:hypothetical protein